MQRKQIRIIIIIIILVSPFTVCPFRRRDQPYIHFYRSINNISNNFEFHSKCAQNESSSLIFQDVYRHSFVSTRDPRPTNTVPSLPDFHEISQFLFEIISTAEPHLPVVIQFSFCTFFSFEQ